jgi:hypothetical protein
MHVRDAVVAGYPVGKQGRALTVSQIGNPAGVLPTADPHLPMSSVGRPYPF